MKIKSYLFVFVLLFIALSSCVEKGYDWDDVNKEGAFSHESGLSIRIGDFDTITFKRQLEVPVVVDIEYIKEFEGLFSDEMYSYFVYDNNGKDEPLGDIKFEADFVSRIKNAAEKNFSDFELSTYILNENDEDTGIQIDRQIYKSDVEQPQLFVVNIKKDDIVKLKDAHKMQLVFKFQSRMVEASDYVLIENIWLKLTGGVSFNI